MFQCSQLTTSLEVAKSSSLAFPNENIHFPSQFSLRTLDNLNKLIHVKHCKSPRDNRLGFSYGMFNFDFFHKGGKFSQVKKRRRKMMFVSMSVEYQER